MRHPVATDRLGVKGRVRGSVAVASLALALLIPSAGALASHLDTPATTDRPSPRTPRPPQIVRVSPRPSVVPGARLPTRTVAPSRPAGAGRRVRLAPEVRRRVVSHGPQDRPAIALTLDDGYNVDTRILDLIDELGVRGTAFLTGRAVTESPWLAPRLRASGWEVCSHTWSHPDLTRLDADRAETEIVRGMLAVARSAGASCRWFRPPYGKVNAHVLRAADRLGLTVVNWNASISDSTPSWTPVAKQVDIAMRDLRPGAILLGHFGNTHSYQVLREVLPAAEAMGLRIGSVSDLFGPARPDEVVWANAPLPVVNVSQAARRPGASDVPFEAYAGAGSLAAGAMCVAASRAARARRRPAAWTSGDRADALESAGV